MKHVEPNKHACSLCIGIDPSEKIDHARTSFLPRSLTFNINYVTFDRLHLFHCVQDLCVSARAALFENSYFPIDLTTRHLSPWLSLPNIVVFVLRRCHNINRTILPPGCRLKSSLFRLLRGSVNCGIGVRYEARSTDLSWRRSVSY